MAGSEAVKSYKVQQGVTRLPKVKNTIAVVSGKGGVGKSTVAVNLAVTLQQQGFKVGVLDADIYGPSLPQLLGIPYDTKPEIVQGKMWPYFAHGLAVMSIGFHLGASLPAVWRGPMASKALQQLFWQTAWPELDYLIIDMPPGTGDIVLTLVQKIPLTSAVAVTTPQDIAFSDVERALVMLAKVEIPVLGLIENMAVYTCNSCGVTQAIFGNKDSKALALQHNTDLLGSLPLDPHYVIAADTGIPCTITQQEANTMLQDIAAKLIAAITKLPRDTTIPIIRVKE